MVDGHAARPSTSPRPRPRRGGASRRSACSRSASTGIKADDGEGFYYPDEVGFADGRSGADAAWAQGLLYRRSMQRALDEVHPGDGVVFGRPGWTGQQAVGVTWGGDQPSDFWSLRTLVAATLTAAASGFSNWSHDVGGYLGERLMSRCPKELLVRWVQFGCFTPLMHAHGRFEQEAWTYDAGDARALPRVRAPARAARALRARGGRPPRRAAGCRSSGRCCSPTRPTRAAGRSPTPTATARRCGSRRCSRPAREEREVELPRGRLDRLLDGRRGGRRRHDRRAGAARPHPGLGPARRADRHPPRRARRGRARRRARARAPARGDALGRARCGRALARLADGAEVRWTRGEWSVTDGREVTFALR